ncbi:MAG: hypothetical protein DWI02_06585 [Planctomycetota bacterium]|nr:MAG: hypothetical protein DWI02_06585 [Planctomycetota bacterium]
MKLRRNFDDRAIPSLRMAANRCESFFEIRHQLGPGCWCRKSSAQPLKTGRVDGGFAPLFCLARPAHIPDIRFWI